MWDKLENGTLVYQEKIQRAEDKHRRHQFRYDRKRSNRMMLKVGEALVTLGLKLQGEPREKKPVARNEHVDVPAHSIK